MKKTFIYIVSNIENNSVYIGKTVNVLSRKYNHMQKYGKNIDMDIIDEINSLDRKDWKPLECFWIEYCRFLGFNVLNQNKGGGGIEFREDKILDIIIQKLKKPILQYSLDGSFVKEWDSIKEAKKKNRCNIDGCLSGKIKTAGKYIWKYKDDKNIDFTFNINPKLGKQVEQYSLNGEFINSFVSASEAEKTFRNDLKIKDNISACCRKQQKTAYGYVWKYKNNN